MNGTSVFPKSDIGSAIEAFIYDNYIHGFVNKEFSVGDVFSDFCMKRFGQKKSHDSHEYYTMTYVLKTLQEKNRITRLATGRYVADGEWTYQTPLDFIVSKLGEVRQSVGEVLTIQAVHDYFQENCCREVKVGLIGLNFYAKKMVKMGILRKLDKGTYIFAN